MKTTLDLEDALLTQAKALAALRRTTLKAIVEHALRRELSPKPEDTNPDPQKFVIGPLGFLILKREPGQRISPDQLKAVEQEIENLEFERAIFPL